MRLTISILTAFFLTSSIGMFAQKEKTITVCEGSEIFFDDLLEAPIDENSNKACTATIRTIKPGYGVEDQGNNYFIFRDVNQTYTITSKRVPSSDSDGCDTGVGVNQTVKVVVEDCKVVTTQASGSAAYNLFAGTYQFVTRYVNQTYCEGQELSRYFVDESGDGELDNTYIYITLPEKNVLLGKTGTLICEDFEKDGSCLTDFFKIEIDKEYLWICDGCTDRAACNYKEAALKDDGSCFYADVTCNNSCSPVRGCTDASARNYNPQANCDDGTCILDQSVDQIFIDYPALNKFTDYSTCANEQITVFKNQYGALYFEVETDLHQLIYNEKGDFECRSNTVEGFPCYSVNISKAQILDTWTCPNQPAITGCSDATACNYNPKAIADDSSCFYKSANNNCFGTCYPEAFTAQFGCTDVSATNYSPLSGCDDGSCIYDGESSIFTRYSFLTNYVDENSCDGEKITTYFDGSSRNKISIETANGYYVFETTGRVLCYPGENHRYECTPSMLSIAETWECGGITTFEETIRDILITKPAFDSYYTYLFTYGGDLPRGDSFTVFAPSQEAFKKIYGDDLVKLTIGVAFNPVQSFFETINNHIVEGTYLSTDLYDGQILTSITGRELIVTINEDGIFINDSKIYEADFETTNGVVHMLNDLLVAEPILLDYPWLETAIDFFRCTDEKLTIYQSGETQYVYVEQPGGAELYSSYGQSFCTDAPGFSCLDAYRLTSSSVIDSWSCQDSPEQPRQTVVDVIVNSDEHNTLEAAVIAAGLAETLSGEGPFTVFAPTDAAFASLPEGTVEALLADPTGDLSQILLYHVLGAQVESTSLTNRQTATTLNGADIKVIKDEIGIFINNAKVTISDIVTDNGVVHVIDLVLLPSFEPQPETELFETYSWLNDVLDTGNCSNEKITVFQSNEVEFVYVESISGGTLFTPEGYTFCTGALSNFSCIDGILISSISERWFCSESISEEPEQPAGTLIFENYNWLEEIVDARNCSNEKVTVYQSGSYQYLYIEDANGESLYTDFGIPFCASSSSYSCVDAYRLSSIVDSWICGDEGGLTPPTPTTPPTPIAGELPEELAALNWLNDIIDINDCAGSSIEVYDFGSYSFVYLTLNGETTMYLNDGTYYCANGTSYNCKSLYSINRTADISWSCGGIYKTANAQFATVAQKTPLSDLSYPLYPNPTTGFVYLDISDKQDQILQINFYDSTGKIILARSVNEQVSYQLQFNLSNQAKGLCLVEVITENTRTTQKLLIE